VSEPDERRAKLERIKAQQDERREADAAADARDKADTDARVELAQDMDEGGSVHAPTRAELVLDLWRAVIWGAPLALVGRLVVGLAGGPLVGSIPPGIVVALAILDLALKTRPRHVEHVRVHVFERGDIETKLYVPVSILYALAALKLLL
jgi:hypothetical protein